MRIFYALSRRYLGILHFLNVFNVKYVNVYLHEHREYGALGGLSAASSYIWD